MKTFYIQFQVVPTIENRQYSLVEGAFAHCWVVGTDPINVQVKSRFFASKYDWKIDKVITLPVEVTREQFLERDLGLEQFDRAQEEGISIVYVAWAKDKKTQAGPFPLEPSHKIDLADFVKTQKQYSHNGRCLHFESGNRCNEVIRAHSIQKNQSLSAIADKGHVYGFPTDIGAFIKNDGNLTLEKRGINNVSTFLGFCKKHDNELFELIDNGPLLPTDHQVFLYAYRSLCRELFVKKNALSVYEDQITKVPRENAVKELISTMRRGTEIGLKNLKRHKSLFDHSLREKSFHDIKYVLFLSKQKPIFAFSSLLYPEFDFLGRQVQNLGDVDSSLKLLTFCSTPMKSGWGFLFAWHKSSSNVCTEFMRSLATKIHEKSDFGDLLFRLVITHCENLAISPQWWEKLPKKHQQQINLRASEIGNAFCINKPTNLTEGLEEISYWQFETVISQME